MNALEMSSPQTDASSSRDASQRGSTVRLPIGEPLDDLEEAVGKLKSCSSTELRRARRHHRRAIESLQEGGYSALSEATRDHLLSRLRTRLKALNQVLDTSNGSDDSGSDSADTRDSFSSRVGAFFQGLW